MKVFADNFSNQSYGNMGVFVRTANARDRITFLVAVLGPGFTNVRNASGSLPSQPKPRCTAPSFPYGSGYWSFII